MTTETRRLHLTIDRLDAAARIWAAACSTTGAMAPDHIADVLSAMWDARQPIPDLSIAAPGGRRARVDWTGEVHRWASWYVDTADLTRQGWEARS